MEGFNFIISKDNEDYFVDVSRLCENLKSKVLRVGQRFSFEVDFGMRGDKANNVREN